MYIATDPCVLCSISLECVVESQNGLTHKY